MSNGQIKNEMCRKYLLDHINENFPSIIKTRGNHKDNKQHKYLITKIFDSKMKNAKIIFMTPLIHFTRIEIRVTFM